VFVSIFAFPFASLALMAITSITLTC
jgi:hypothetical protein